MTEIPLWYQLLAVFGAVMLVAIPGWLLLHYLAEKFADQQGD